MSDKRITRLAKILAWQTHHSLHCTWSWVVDPDSRPHAQDLAEVWKFQDYTPTGRRIARERYKADAAALLQIVDAAP